MDAIYDGALVAHAAPEPQVPAQLSQPALRGIADAAVDIADSRGSSRSTIGWNKQRALAEKVLRQIYLAGWRDAMRAK